MSLPAIPEIDARADGLAGLATREAATTRTLLDTVLAGLGTTGRLLGSALGLTDRLAGAWMRRANDPYLDDAVAVSRAIGRAGGPTFALAYEIACTTRAFDGDPPELFRTLDWSFRGLGRAVRVVHLDAPAGPWSLATWPGVIGAAHGIAPGRFALALNQAPERRTGLGDTADWLAARARFFATRGLTPPHLVRLVLERAPDFASARAMLVEHPLALAGIFTLTGTRPGEIAVIERHGPRAVEAAHPWAANHWSEAPPGRWRSRGEDSEGRYAAAAVLPAPPAVDAIAPPVLNGLTRLAMTMDASGRLDVCGWEDGRLATRPLATAVPG